LLSFPLGVLSRRTGRIVNAPDNQSFPDLYERLLEAAREVARRNRKRIDNLRRQFDLTDELTHGFDGEENALSDE
jgi:hypothetical protein